MELSNNITSSVLHVACGYSAWKEFLKILKRYDLYPEKIVSKDNTKVVFVLKDAQWIYGGYASEIDQVCRNLMATNDETYAFKRIVLGSDGVADIMENDLGHELFKGLHPCCSITNEYILDGGFN